jgi:hypothetical protein
MIWYLNFRLLQKHGQEYQLASLISMSTAQFRMAHVLFTPECRYVKQEENSSFFLKPKSEAIGGLSNLKALPLACQQVSDSIPEGLNSCEKLLTE